MIADQWSPDLIIYHDKCADGIVAAWACWRRWGNQPAYLACNYGMSPPEVDAILGRNILIVDFSFPEEDLRAMIALGAQSIVILDHHKTAQAALEPFQVFAARPERFTPEVAASMFNDLQIGGYPPILALFDMERSGARMAWDFASRFTFTPRLVELAEQYDLWRFQPGEHSPAEALHVEIQAGEMTVERMEVLDGQLTLDDRPIERGRAILRWKDQLVQEIAARAHLRTVAGVPDVIAVECPYSLVSAVGHYLLDQHPAAPFAAMSVSGEKSVTWSLRSHDDRTDVSEVAKSMGGGGHRNAAGFRENMVDDAAALAAKVTQQGADLVYQAKMLERVRDGLLFMDELDDEGDRVYFRSTNHADHFRDLYRDLRDWDMERAVFPAEDRDLYAEMRALRAENDRLYDLIKNPPKHDYWKPGDPDCPREIKAGNGELHTLRCKVCGQDSPRDVICRAGLGDVA
ncbi:DHHA1 domain-containing protein [Novosphingobium pentaromativorans]|nr:DHHA1 domain-containing protein [Novosphingobium pentaromativorans]